ncbi:signal peptidase I [Evansella halocellulosilytica]|uniref:signal peptidase I n=1 Tax=Evansella halocellulosilytica TaxID=2011013 RepID=UPI000BB7AB63|nr:signal peptidase I [Evansella halocellulosilytica]
MNYQDVISREYRSPEKKKSWKRELWSWMKTIAIVLILVIVVRGFVFTNYIVYGQSMMPTINDGERIIVNKIGYEIQEPDRFDLIIFHATEETDYIKRVIGLPGDHIAYEDDTLLVNGEAFDEDFLMHYKEEHVDNIYTDNFTLEDITGYATVPEGHVFVLGDNRQNSVDSRQIGFVELEDIVGKANMAYWPPKNFRLF